jgi:hypothetical protein
MRLMVEHLSEEQAGVWRVAEGRGAVSPEMPDANQGSGADFL